MSERKFRLQVSEGELRALISHHAHNIIYETNVEISKRLHDLVRRLHNDAPEIGDDPRPQETAANNTANPASW